jgi:hypothetical protein
MARASRVIALAIVMVAMAIIAVPAWAATSRAEYVAQVDPICQQERASQKAVIRSFTKQVKTLEKRGFDPQKPSKPIGRVVIRGYDRLAMIQRAADSQIGGVIPAPGDEAITASWLQKRATFTQLFRRAGHVFAHQKRRSGLRLFVRALNTEGHAAALIGQFGFVYCVQIVPGF